MYSYRIFISYAHDDRGLACSLVAALRRLGLCPVWDDDLQKGSGFTEAIKNDIATAHIFVPLITSQNRPWVHQETGYALGVGVPILPVAPESVPVEAFAHMGMIAHLSVVRVRDDFSDLEEKLKTAGLDKVVQPSAPAPIVGTQIRESEADRTDLLVKCLQWLEDEKRWGTVRQRALFSSLSIPDAEETAPIWDLLDGERRRSPALRRLLRQERLALQTQIQHAGCTLLVAEDLDWRPVGRAVHCARLQTLLGALDSLVSLNKNGVKVYFSPLVAEGHMTIVGDWFAAYAQMPLPGSELSQTVFSLHAPTVLKRVQLFDAQVAEVEAKWSWESVRKRLVDRLAALERAES